MGLATEDGPLAPPLALRPPRSSRGALGPWPQLLEAVEELSRDPATHAEFQQAFGVSFGGPGELLNLVRHDPGYLVASREPVDLYGRFVRGVMRTKNGAEAFVQLLTVLESLLEAESSIAADAVRQLLAGDGGLAPTASDLAGHYAAFVADLERLDTSRRDSLAAFREAGQALAEQGQALASTPAENLAGLRSVAHEADRGAATAIGNLRLAASKVAIGAILANLTAAVKSVATGWADVAASAAHLADTASDADLVSFGYFESVGIRGAVSEWGVLAEECTRYIADVFVTT